MFFKNFHGILNVISVLLNAKDVHWDKHRVVGWSIFMKFGQITPLP